MSNLINPFVVAGPIPEELFCDRKNESSQLIKYLRNGNNVLLISPRRMGKTGLVEHCYGTPEIRDNYYTFFVDILHTSSLRELIFEIGKEIYGKLASRNRKAAVNFLSALKSIQGSFGFNPTTNMPSFSIELGSIERPEFTLEEIFGYLAEADKPCILAIDEFQQIANFPEKNVEALLRSHIQIISNCHFIFAGSEKHIMQEMFLAYGRPFYQSASVLELGPIGIESYVPFATRLFKMKNRSISAENVETVYRKFEGHTFYMQKILNESFTDTPEGKECTSETIDNATDHIISSYDSIYRQMLSNMPEKQKALLYAVAKDGKAEQLTSQKFVSEHKLGSASSVQSALRVLTKKELVVKSDESYSLNDKILELWIRQRI